ncbi:hypothetical protein ROS62_23250 [Streptomyces sp. DSM 41972]|uniref:Uncharacterized protein n=1 Tax=Streptomyces althioticus subsp. attaecolombicae TaxID=3075534 RepID=A0ABU3I3W7_9ACTN|nr:hypothetical protein [Streptomyces sp. DSM 41972]
MDPDSLQLLPAAPGQEAVIETSCLGPTCDFTCLVTCGVTG